MLTYIIRPAITNSSVALIMTLVNIYVVQRGHLSITAKVTVAVTTVLSLCTLILYGIYTYLIKRIRELDTNNIDASVEL